MKRAIHTILPFAFLIICAVAPLTCAETGASTVDEREQAPLFGGTAVTPQAESRAQQKPDDMEDVTEEQAESVKEEAIADPLEPFNRAMYHFNDKLYFWLIKPLAQGYGFIIPKPVREAIDNIYDNVKAPIRIVNNALQGKFENAAMEMGRFVTNSTVGIAGIFDVATKLELKIHKEDLGQTFAVWGMGHGFYLVLPFIGPSSARDAVGWVGDRFLHPVSYVQPWELATGLTVHEWTNYFSLHIGDYEAIKKAAVDPYLAIRNGYVQYRKKVVQE